MSYRNRLQPWCIVRHLPNAQNAVVERFRNRVEAEDYLRTLKQLMPTTYHSLIFDPGDNQTPQNQAQFPIATDRSRIAHHPNLRALW